jgi:hypothetical protein
MEKLHYRFQPHCLREQDTIKTGARRTGNNKDSGRPLKDGERQGEKCKKYRRKDIKWTTL